MPNAVEPPSESPTTLAAALALLADGSGPPWRPIAGGTDLMVQLTGEIGEPPERILDIWALDELRGIARRRRRVLVIGALTTYTELRRSPVVAEFVPALVEAAATIGAAQIQNRGTLGGNVVNASPAGRHAAGPAGPRRQMVLASATGERERGGRRLLARVPHDRAPRRRAAGPHPDPAHPRSAGPVPQGRHAPRTGDQQGRHGARLARLRRRRMVRRAAGARIGGGDDGPSARAPRRRWRGSDRRATLPTRRSAALDRRAEADRRRALDRGLSPSGGRPRPASAAPGRGWLVVPIQRPRREDVLVFPTTAELHRWFEANHDTAPEAFIGFHRKGVGKPSVTYAEIVEEALCFGWIDGITFRDRRRGHRQPLHAAPADLELERDQHREDRRASCSGPDAAGRPPRFRGARPAQGRDLLVRAADARAGSLVRAAASKPMRPPPTVGGPRRRRSVARRVTGSCRPSAPRPRSGGSASSWTRCATARDPVPGWSLARIGRRLSEVSTYGAATAVKEYIVSDITADGCQFGLARTGLR